MKEVKGLKEFGGEVAEEQQQPAAPAPTPPPQPLNQNKVMLEKKIMKQDIYSKQEIPG